MQNKPDFDTKVARTQEAEEDELQNLRALFELLRAGRIEDAQTQLMQTNHTELFEWVSGGIPAFDNASFIDSEEFGDFIPNELERASKI